MSTIRVVLVDDHTLVRSGLKTLLAEMDGVEVVAEASDGKEAISLVRQYTPDVVLMDISMQDMNGLDASAQIINENPAVRIIVLSMHDGEDYVARALKSGAAAYVLKHAAPVELELALRAVARGETFLSPRVSRTLVDAFVGRTDPGDGGAGPLTARQLDILRHIANGLSTKQIAFELNVSIKTVESHRAQIMERLEIRDLAGLVRYAIRTGLIEP